VGPVAAALACAALAAPAAALEARFDHRDQSSLSVEPILAYDSVAIPGRTTSSTWRPTLRLAYGWDLLGEGNELLLGAQGRIGSWSDPEREEVLFAADARYRAYFGTDQWKTFFDLGAWVPIRSRLAIGPLVGIGFAYDYDRSGGFYLNGSFGTGFGEARIASLAIGIGWQRRW
jgi:hypothetical protein